MLKTTLEPAAFTANVKHTSTCSRREHNINWETSKEGRQKPVKCYDNGTVR